MNFKDKKIEWNLVIINDPLALSGKIIHDVVRIISNLLNILFVGISDLEGAGIRNLMNDDESPIIQLDEFLKKVMLVQQFDWGDFFLFDKFPENWETFYSNSYPEIISFTKTTVRAVDDTYVYIYTPYQSVIKLICENYVIEEIKKDKLKDLEYPF